MENPVNKNKEQLLKEIDQLRIQNAKLEDTKNDFKKKEEQLLKSKERYKGIIQSTASCIAVYQAIEKGKNFVIVDFNPMAEEVEQISKDQVIGKKVTEVFPGVVEFGLFKVFKNVFKTGKAEHFPIGIYQDDRIKGYRDNYVYKLPSEEIVIVYQDLTKQKQAEEDLRESQAFNESLLNISPDIIYIYDIVEQKNIYSNEGIVKVLGYSIEEVKSMGKNLIPKLMHPDDFTIYLEETIPKYQTAKDGDLIEHEYRMKHKNRSWCWLHSKESIYARLKDGTPKQIFGIIGNITEQKQADEVLKSSRDYLNKLTNSITDAIYSVKMPERVIEWVNDSFNIFGYKPDECIGKSTRFLHVNQDSYKSFGKKLNEIIVAGKDVLNTEHLLKRKNGEIFPSEVTVTFHKGNNGIVNITTVIRDITERKKSAGQIKRYSRIFEDSLNEIFLFDANTLKFIQANIAAQQNLGYTMEELHKMTPLDFKPEFTAETFTKLVAPLRKGKKKKIIFETVHQRKDQSRYNVEVHLQLLHFEDQDIFAAFILDITERTLADDSRKMSESLLKAAMEATADGILVVDKDGTWSNFNQKFVDIWGIPDSICESGEDKAALEYVIKSLAFPDEFIAKITELYDNQKSNSFDIIELLDGRILERYSQPQWLGEDIIGRVWSFRNITKRKQAEEELAKHREQLEELVKERTLELEEKNKRLDDSMKVFVGRELTINKLQDRIRALEGK